MRIRGGLAGLGLRCGIDEQRRIFRGQLGRAAAHHLHQALQRLLARDLGAFERLDHIEHFLRIDRPLQKLVAHIGIDRKRRFIGGLGHFEVSLCKSATRAAGVFMR